MDQTTKKWLVYGGSGGLIFAVLGILVMLYPKEVKTVVNSFTGCSSSKTSKSVKDRDRGPVLTTSAKAVKKPATAKKAKELAAAKKKQKAKELAAAKKKQKAKAKKVDKKAAAAPTEKPLALREAELKNPCASLPFSYEFAKGDPDAKDHFYKRFWGPNYGCLLAGAYDRRMPGPVPQVRARLEKMSPTRFARYQVRLEKIMRRFACRTFDYYLSTCKEVFDSAHENYLLNEDLRVLFQRSASFHDIGAVDRFRFRKAKSTPTKVAKPTSAELPATDPATTDSATKPQQRRRLRVSLKTRRLPRLCGSKLRLCPKP